MNDLERALARINPSISLETEEKLAEKIIEILFNSSFSPILRADTKRSLEEAAKRSRIWKWIKDARAFATITAWRSSLPYAENRKRMAKLLIKLRSKNLGVIAIQGFGQEGDQVSKEKAFFVFLTEEDPMDEESFRRYIEKLAKEFDQFAYVYGTNGGKDIRLYVKDNGTYKVVERWNHTTFRPDYLIPDEEDGLYYSLRKDKPFQFQRKEVQEHISFGYMNGLAFNSFSKRFRERYGYSIYGGEK